MKKIQDGVGAASVRSAHEPRQPARSEPKPSVSRRERAASGDGLDAANGADGPSLQPPALPSTTSVVQAPLYEQTPVAKGVRAAFGSVGQQVHHATTALGDEFRAAGGALKDAGVTLASSEATDLGSAYERFSGELDEHLDLSWLDAESVRARAQGLADEGVGLSGRFETMFAGGVGAVRDSVGKVKAAAKSAIDAVASFTKNVAGAMDYREHIAKLGPTDSYTLGLDGYVDSGLVRIKGRSSLKVSRDDEGFSVSVDGALGGGLVLSWGFSAGPVAGLVQNVTTLDGGAVAEFRFDTAEQATQAVEVLLRAKERRVPVTEATPLTSWDDLPARLQGFGLSGGMSNDVFSALGAVVGATSLTGAKAIKSVRVERGDAGPELVVKTAVSSSTYIDTGAVLGAVNDAFPVYAGQDQVELSVSRRFAFPKSVSFDDMRRSPLSTLTANRGALTPVGEDTLALDYESESGVMGQTAGRGGTLRIDAQAGEVLGSANVLQRVARGDVAGVVEALPSDAQLEADLRPHQKFGVRMSPFFTAFGFGAGVDFVAQRTDAKPEEGTTVKGAPADIAKALAKATFGSSGPPQQLWRG